MPQKTEILKPKNEEKNILTNTNTKIKNKNNPKKNYSNNLLKKCQMKYNSFIRDHRDITMSGNKRYEDKSGEYYLQNLGKFQKNNLNINQKSITSLNINDNNSHNANNNNYHSNKHIIKVKKKKLFDELIPIPIMKQKNKIKNDFEKKNLNNAMDNAKYIRRFQYSNNISQKQIQQYKEMKKSEQIFFEKVKFIQIWWKTIFQIIKIQKYLRGYLYRIKLISILDQREKYIDKVLNMVKCFKKLFLYKYFNNLFMYNNHKKFYFNKWNEIINKKNIIIKLKKNHSPLKLFDKEYKDSSNDCIIISKSNDKANKKDDMDFELEDIENEFCKFKNKNNNNNNKSLIEIYTNNINKSKKISNNRRENNLSSSSFILRPRKDNLNNGIDLSSSQILRRRRNSIYDINQTNYNKKNNQKNIQNKKINIFDNIIKSGNKRNNNKKIIKNKKENNNNKLKTSIKGIYQKEKSFNDLKIKNNNKNKYNNLNKNITPFNGNTNKYNSNHELTKSTNINSFNKNIRLSVGGQSNILKSKNNLNLKKKMHKCTDSNLSNYSTNILNNNKNKIKNKNNKIKKKKKVYENKLNYYNKKLNLENNEKEYLSIDKDNNILDKIQPYTESIFDESQFSAILDNSTLNNNKNTITYNNDEEKSISNKKIRSNPCIEIDSLIEQKIPNNNDIIQKYFTKWSKKTIFILLLNKLHGKRNIILALKILIKLLVTKMYRIFMNKFEIYYFFINWNKISNFFNDLKMKLFVKEIKFLSGKYILLKYFKTYKDIICKKIMIENIVENRKNNIKKKNKGIKKRNKKQLFFSDCNLGNNGFITDTPYNNFNNNFINNNINLNNNTNNCYIINNLNYNDNTNKINLGLTYQSDLNNYMKKPNSINSFGIIRSKLIEFPQNLNQPKKIKQSIALYNLNNNNNSFKDNFNNTIDNCNLFNNNTNSNPTVNNNNNNKKASMVYKHNLSKSVILSNNIDYLEPDMTAQKNQLTMVINIIERHRKTNKHNIFFSFFKKWKNILNNNTNISNICPKSSDNKITMRNKKHIIDTLNSFKNKKKANLIINFSDSTKDVEELTKNTINTEGFHTESDTKSENKMSIKSIKITSNKNLFLDNNKGVYKKKTIGSNKALNFVKKNKNKINVNNINNTLNQNQNNDLKLNNVRLSTNIISHNYDIQDFNKDDNENKYIRKPLSDKNLNLLLKNNNNDNDDNNGNLNNIEYYSSEEYLGFKKANKIEEMEISFFPLNENKIKTNYNDININLNNNNYINSFNNNIKGKECDEIDKKEVIIEAIEEYNEYDENNENLVQKIKNEFINYQTNFMHRTFSNLKIKFNNNLFGEQKESISFLSMSDIV